jgi:epoxyqueuosine reductase
MKNFQEQIKEKALELDFDSIGFCEADFPEEVTKHLHEFVAKGRHGSMNWIFETIYRRSKPRNMWQSAQTAIVLGCNYGPEKNPLQSLNNKSVGNISVYAQNKDYHKWIKGRLKNLAGWIASKTKGQVKIFVDTAPLMEKPLAEISGIGWIGKHTNLVSRNFGSWLFLGVILIDLNILDNNNTTQKSNCGSCSECIDICPTKAFVAPYKLDASRCISYLTIEHKSHIPREFRDLIGNRIYGCDDCLAICPWNKYAKKSNNISFIAREDLKRPLLEKLSFFSDEDFRKFFSGSPIKRIGRDQFIRNVLIAIGNSADPSLVKNIINLLDDDSPIVRLASVWALGKICKDSFLLEMNKRVNQEKEQEVINEWFESKKDINKYYVHEQ